MPGKRNKEIAMPLTQGKTLTSFHPSFYLMASHEFKTPLTAIASSLELLETKMQQDSLMAPFYASKISRIKQEISVLHHMVDEMLASGKTNRTPPLLPGETDVAALAREIKQQYFTTRTDKRYLQIKVSGTPRNIPVDKNQLNSVLINLISNAFKYSTAGNPVLSLLFRKKEMVIKVADTGIGIPAKDLRHIFTSWYRGSNTAHIAGSGLGLAIIKAFVTTYQGTIEVISKENKGAVFILSLPV